MDGLDRVALNRALAKAIAFKQCGKQGKANAWAIELVKLLDTMDILDQGQLTAHVTPE